MGYLSDLISDSTPVIKLRNDRSVTEEEKNHILGNIIASKSRKEEYLKMIYLMNNTWYYFKKESGNDAYPFHLINELMGSYLAKTLGLKSLDFSIAKTKTETGLLSPNFKEEGYSYCFGDYYQKVLEAKINRFHDLSVKGIHRLSILCPNEENASKLIDEFLNMVALDTYMLQTDRGPANIQFVINHESKEVSLSAIYDYANCKSSENCHNLFLKNCIATVMDLTIPEFVKEFPQFKEYLVFLIEQGYLSTWNTICDDFSFNRDSEAYETVTNYFKDKEEFQKNYLYSLIKKDPK